MLMDVHERIPGLKPEREDLDGREYAPREELLQRLADAVDTRDRRKREVWHVAPDVKEVHRDDVRVWWEGEEHTRFIEKEFLQAWRCGSAGRLDGEQALP